MDKETRVTPQSSNQMQDQTPDQMTDALKKKANFYAWLKALIPISEEYSKGLVHIARADVQSRTNAAITAISTAGAKIVCALIADVIPQMGVLLQQVYINSTAATQYLQDSYEASFSTFICDRSVSAARLKKLLDEGQITKEEFEEAGIRLVNDINENIQRSHELMKHAMAAIDSLTACTIKNIRQTEDALEQAKRDFQNRS